MDYLHSAPQLHATLEDQETGVRAFVVADRFRGGLAMGGTRVIPSVTLDEVKDLARCMTLKLALSGVGLGGAKAGVILPPGGSPEDRRRHLAAFGRLVAPLMQGGVYLGTDLGISYLERDFFHECAGFSIPSLVPTLPCTWGELWAHCGGVTGCGVAHAGALAADLLSLPDHRRQAVIQGFGEVGQGTARFFRDLGIPTIAVADAQGTVRAKAGALPVEAMCEIVDARGIMDRDRLPAGTEIVEGPEAWLDIDAGILVLAAVADSIREDNVARVKADLVVEGANMPVTSGAAQQLGRRGVGLVPDIIANAGGAIACGLALQGTIASDASAEQAAQWLFDEVARRVRDNTRAICENPETSEIGAHQLARRLAVHKIAELHP